MIGHLRHKILRLAAVIALAIFSASSVGAQERVAIKSNLLYDAGLTPNLGIELGLAPKWSADISGQINDWAVGGRLWKQWLVQPELRYWFCRRFSGHFVGAHALGGQYNFGHVDLPFTFLGTNFSELKDHRRQGWMGGLGVAYGYAWILDRHWNLEAEIGLGWIYTVYDTYRCANCGKKIKENSHHNYFGPTKAAINIVYIF